MTDNCLWCDEPLPKNSTKQRQYHKKCRNPRQTAKRKELQRKGICIRCKKKHSGDHQRCEDCLKKQRIVNRKHLEAEKGKRVTGRGICAWCKKPTAVITRLPSWFHDDHFHAHCHKEQLAIFEKCKRKILLVNDSAMERTRKALMQELEEITI